MYDLLAQLVEHNTFNVGVAGSSPAGVTNKNLINMEEKEITVEFKESYMPHSVKRTCVNMTKEQIIKQYDLNSSDIEWYKFID